jgi:hypothetical protein
MTLVNRLISGGQLKPFSGGEYERFFLLFLKKSTKKGGVIKNI